MKIVVHGSLKDKFASMDIVAETVADAIEGWSRQCGLSDIPLDDRPVIDILNFKTFEELHSITEVTEIHLYPAMYGGGGGFGKILLGAALIAIAIWNPGIGGMVLSQAGVGAVAGAGIGMAIGGVMELFMKAPSVSKANDPDPSKYLGSSGNTTAIGTLIPKGYGRFLIPGQYLSIQVNSNDMVYGTFPSTVPA